VDFLDDFNRILGTKFTATTMEECMDPAGSPVLHLVQIRPRPNCPSTDQTFIGTTGTGGGDI